MPGAWQTAPPRDNLGRSCCRWCRGLVTPPRSTFCSAECVHEWKLRTSTGYLRKCVLKRDKGICAVCKVNTRAVTKGFRRPLKNETKEQWKRRVAKVKKQYGIPKHRKTFFDVDHIVPVYEGGGECGLSEVQLLCIRCHKLKTKLEAKKRSSAKK